MKMCEDQKEVKSEKDIPTQKSKSCYFSCVVFFFKFVHVINNYFILLYLARKAIERKTSSM